VSRSGNGRWGRRRLREIEAVRHVGGGGVACVQGFQAKRRLAELQQADVRVPHVGDVPLPGIGAEDEAADARSVAELRSVLPLLGERRVDVVEPATPVVPRDKDDGLRPQSAAHDRVHLLHGPRHAVRDVADRRIALI
jgi:hypothetical protein